MSSDSRADGELVRAVLEGDRSAFGAVVDRYLPTVLAVIARIVCNRADAEDLAQDTFVRAYQRLGQYGQAHSFRNWLLKIATNLALNHLQSRRREQSRLPRMIEMQSQRSAGPEGPQDVPGPREWQRWLSKLDEPHRAAIVLFHFQELSYAEIAEAIDVPLNTVRTYLHRGRRRLKELMSARAVTERESWTAVIPSC
ncbi:MAG: RNA polymerase sigma factor [Phycisphaerae bacterium]